MIQRIEALAARWDEAQGAVAIRMRPWAARMLDAARTSLACGLVPQAERLLERVERTLPQRTEGPRVVSLQVSWNAEGVPRIPAAKREEELWRKVRSLRSQRRPYDGAQHPGRRGLAWGPYNRASAVVEMLECAARVDPLWVDDFLERDRAASAIDRLLGIAG